MERLFNCPICERAVIDYKWRLGRYRQIAPVCLSCEKHYGDREPSHGAFMDRRRAAQLSALANALSSVAHMKQWRARHG